MAFVIKVSYADTLRRFSLRKEDAISFATLESQIRDLFGIPAHTKLSMMYTDEDSDQVTMTSDRDFLDALFHQNLNPLRVTVNAGGKSRSSSTSTSSKPWAAAEKIRADAAEADEIARARIEARALSEMRLADAAAEAQIAMRGALFGLYIA